MSLHKEGLVQMPRESTERHLKGGFIQRTKSFNLCPYWSAKRFACFVVFCFLITPSTDGQQSHISSEKFTQQDSQTSAASSTDKKPFLQNKALLLGQFILFIHIQMVPWSSSSMYSSGGSSCPNVEHKLH